MNNTSTRQPNREQQLVIDDLDHNMILFASAGTGKTFSVAQHVAKIISSGRALPEEILCLTFTIKAANEMKDDVLKYVGDSGKDVSVSTIHSFCYHVLREERKRSGNNCAEPVVCDENDEGDMLADIIVNIVGEAEAKRMRVYTANTRLANVMSILKSRREIDDQYTSDNAEDFRIVYSNVIKDNSNAFRKTVRFFENKNEVYDTLFLSFLGRYCGEWSSAYSTALQQSNLLDFDDLICQVHSMFKNDSIAEYWRNRYKYIIIDEMQDTSELEYDALKPIFIGNKVLMCGDFFQTIYTWRGSNPQKILNAFTSDFSAQKHMFSDNYRATRLLTRASFGYLQNTYPNLVGVYCPKDIHTISPSEGERIAVVDTSTFAKEASWIYDYLLNNMPEDPTKVCIMARTNTYIKALYEKLAYISNKKSYGNALHFFTVDNDSKFFRKAIIKDILAFLRLLLNPTDAVSLRRIAEKYVQGVGVATLSKFSNSGLIGVSPATFIDNETHLCGDPFTKLLEASKNDNIVIYDTETTGLDLSKDQIIQISALRLNRQGRIIDTIDLLVVPTVPISKAAQATHHKSLEYIKENGGVSIREALQKFSAFVDGAVLVGHNSIRFDAPLVCRQLKECDLPKLNILAEYDTMVIAKMFLPKLVNYKLDTLCKRYGVINDNAHDALGDITATGKALFCMLGVIEDTRIERKALISKYIDKFEKLHEFLQYLDIRLQAGCVCELIQRIVEKCCLFDRYTGDINEASVSDLLYAISQSDTSDGPSYVRELLTDAALSGSQIDLLIKKLHKIPIITVHQSKGCEFDTVIIAGADDSNFPSFSAQKEGTTDEEQRVFYVAISRSKKKLILTYASDEGYYGRQPSRYIKRIPEGCLERVRR